jgi:hypothetical protein
MSKKSRLLAEVMMWGEDGLKVGLPKTAREDENPLHVPKDVTALESKNLGDLFWKLGQEASYVAGELAKVEIEHIDYSTLMNRHYARRYLDLAKEAPKSGKRIEGGKDTLGHAIQVEDEYQILQDAVNMATARRKYLEAAHEALKRSQQQISREFARRGINLSEKALGITG